MKRKIGNLWKKNQIMITALAIMIAIAGYLNFTGKQFDKESKYENTAKFSDGDIESLDDDGLDLNEEASNVEDTLGVEEIALTEEDSDFASLGGENASEVASETEASELATEDGTQLSSEELQTKAEAELAKGAEEGETPGEAVFTSGANLVSLKEANLTREQMRAQNKRELLNIINNTELSDEVKVDAITSMIALTKIASMECDTQIMLEAKGFADTVVSINNDTVDVLVGAAELSEAQRAQIEDIVKRKTGMSGEQIIISPVGKE